MGVSITANDLDPMEAMAALSYWNKVDLIIDTKKSWVVVLNDLVYEIPDVVAGRFWVTMSREDEMTDERCFFVVRCEDRPDAELVAAHYPMSTLHPEPSRRLTPAMPDWLKNFGSA